MIRSAPARSSSVFAARTAAGPPPSTTGIRYDSAPSSTCAPNPAASGTARPSSRVPTAAHEGADATATTSAIRDAVSQTAAASTDQVGYDAGGFPRAVATNARPTSASPPR